MLRTLMPELGRSPGTCGNGSRRSRARTTNSGMRGASMVSAIGTSFNAWGHEGIVNFQAGRRSRAVVTDLYSRSPAAINLRPTACSGSRRGAKEGREPAAPSPKSCWATTSVQPTSDGAREYRGVSTKRSGFGWPAVHSEDPANADFGDLPPHSRLLTCLSKDANLSRDDANCA